jgi:hypothetical protein
MQRRAGLDARPLRAFWVMLGLGVLAVGVPILIAARGGALGIPRSDDWSYLLVQFRFAETGRVELNNWVSMTLIGQVLLGTPVALVAGRNIAAMQWFTALLGLVGIVTVAWMGHLLLRPRWLGPFVAAMVAVGPLWGPLAVSFMTDVPSFTFGMLSLAAGIVAVRREPVSVGAVALALVLGLVAFSIRQYGIIPPAATVVVACWVLVARGDWTRLRHVLVLTAGTAVLAGAVFIWWRDLPSSLALSPALPTFHSVRSTAIKNGNLVRLVGLLASPALVLAGPRALVTRAWRASRWLTLAAGIASAVVLAALYFHVPERPFVGNYVARDGVLAHDVSSGSRPDVVPRSVFEIMVVVGSIGAVLLVLAAVPFLVDLCERLRSRRFRPTNPAIALIGMTTAGYLGAYVLATLCGLPLYDRYALPLVALTALLVLHASPPPMLRRETPAEPVERRRLRPLAGALALVLLGLVGLAYTADSASFDGTRWRVATAATRRGFEPLQIDGGFEWNDYHLGFAPSTSRPPNSGAAPAKPTALERSLHYCIDVFVNPSRRYRVVVAAELSSAFSRKPARIVAVRTRRCRSSGRVRGSP